jgi:quinoprotein relay system zinc metallohydrolase 2
MRVLLNIVAVAMLLALLGCVANQPAAQAAAEDGFILENLGNGIYVHHGKHLDIDDGYTGDICNISFVVGEHGVAVIDTGGSLTVGQQLRAAIQKITNKPIIYVINTHVHPDHIFGNAAFLPSNVNEKPPKFIGHEKLEQAMHTRKDGYDKLNVRFLGADAKGTDIVVPNIAIKSVETLDLGDRQLKVIAHPNAHTNTDITVEDSKTQTLFTGDLLFVERTPVIEGDIKGLITMLDTLKTYSFKQVVPGHGSVQKTNQDGITAINNAQRYFTTLLTDIRASIKKGESMEATMGTAAASEKDNWVLFDIANRRNVNTIFPALEWE